MKGVELYGRVRRAVFVEGMTRIAYDREERSQLAVEQGKFAEDHFIKPHRAVLDAWSARFAA